MATAKNSGYFPPSGQQNPSKYPRVGANYLKYGEQPGWTYSPRDDKYYRDQASRDALTKYEEDQGLREKKPEQPKQPGLGDVILPVAATAATTAIATEYGKEIPGLFKTKPSTPKLDQTLNTTGQTAPTPSNVNGTVNGPTQIGGTAPVTGQGQIAGTPQGLLSANQAPTPGAAGIPSGSTSAGSSVVGTGPVPGSTLMRDGSIAFPDGTVKLPDGVTVDTAAGTAVKSDGAPVEASNLGAYLQGAMAIYQGYQAYKQFKDGDKLGGTASGVSAGLSGAGALTGSTALGGAGAVLGYYAPSYIKYGGKAIKGEGTALDNAKTLALTNPVTAWAVPIVDAVEGWTGSKKGKDQQIRDKVRDYLQENKIIDEEYKGTLADGSSFDFGKDGKGLKLDFKDPLVGRAAGLANVISAGENLTGRAQEATAYLYAAAMKSNAKDENGLVTNFQHFAKQRGFTPDAVQNQLNKQFAEKKISKEQLDAYSFELSRSLGQPKISVGAPPIEAPAQPGNTPGGLTTANKPAPLPAGQTPTTTAAGAKSQPLAPGQTPDQAAGAASGGLLAALPPRSKTSSPGMDKNGRRIRY